MSVSPPFFGKALRSIAFAFAFTLAAPASAVEVSLIGIFGQKAVLVVNNGSPKTVSIGQSLPEGILLVAIENETAVLEIDGTRKRIRLGQRAIQTAGKGGPEELVLHGDSKGHFTTYGKINGSSIRFLVDTGATSIAIGSSDARRLGVSYLNAPVGHASTANGIVAYRRVKLNKVELGPFVLHNVDAAVLDQDMQPALLGMSFLNRLDMVREGNTLKLKQRY